MPAPYLCAPGVTLRDQINTRWPERDRSSDGWIGDVAHAARVSDHNPDEDGIVHAIDIDEDLLGKSSPNPDIANDLAQQIVDCGRTDPRLAYVIFEGRIASRARGWNWRRYSGTNAHEGHIHVSFTRGAAGAHPFAIALLGVLPVRELARGAAGPEVVALQQRLAALANQFGLPGFHPGAPDGRFGPATDRALRAIQAAYALPVDGLATPATRSALGL